MLEPFSHNRNSLRKSISINLFNELYQRYLRELITKKSVESVILVFKFCCDKQLGVL